MRMTKKEPGEVDELDDYDKTIDNMLGNQEEKGPELSESGESYGEMFRPAA